MRDLVVEIGRSGRAAHGFPREFGGGGDIGASIASFEALAYGDLSVLVKSGVQFGLFGGAVLQLGTRAHHERYLPDILSGRLLGCFAMTETGHGSNVQALGTTATYDAATDELVVRTPDDAARKDYIGGAAEDGELAVVFAQLEVGGEGHGVHAVLVPLRRDGEVLPGIRVEDCGAKLGLEGVDNGRLWFDDVRVPRENLLDRFATIDGDGTYRSAIENPDRRFFTMLGTLVQGRVSVGGGALSASKVALEIAVRYALRRRQFEAPGGEQETLLLDYGMHQRRLLPLLARAYALSAPRRRSRGSCTRSSRRTPPRRTSGPGARWSRGRPAPRRSRRGTRARPSRSAARRAAAPGTSRPTGSRRSRPTPTSSRPSRATTTCCSSSSPRACSPTTPRSSRTSTSAGWSASSRAWRSRRSSSAPRPTSCSSASATCCPAAATAGTAEAGLLDPDYQLAMLRFREEHQIAGVARRLKAGVDAGRPAGEVFAEVQDHVIAAARSHVERLVLEAFVARVRALPPAPGREVLTALCDLHALTTIESDRGWFLEHGRLSAPRSKAITREVSACCAGCGRWRSSWSRRSASRRRSSAPATSSPDLGRAGGQAGSTTMAVCWPATRVSTTVACAPSPAWRPIFSWRRSSSSSRRTPRFLTVSPVTPCCASHARSVLTVNGIDSSTA